MEKIDLLQSLKIWGELASRIGNPVWERNYKGSRKDYADRTESGVMNYLIAQMMPKIEAIQKGWIEINDENDDKIISLGLRGLGQLLNSSLSDDLKGSIALAIFLHFSGMTLFAIEEFILDKRVCFQDEHGVWNPAHLLEFYRLNPEGEHFQQMFREWFRNRSGSSKPRKEWAVRFISDYLKRQELWPESKNKDSQSNAGDSNAHQRSSHRKHRHARKNR